MYQQESGRASASEIQLHFVGFTNENNYSTNIVTLVLEKMFFGRSYSLIFSTVEKWCEVWSFFCSLKRDKKSSWIKKDESELLWKNIFITILLIKDFGNKIAKYFVLYLLSWKISVHIDSIWTALRHTNCTFVMYMKYPPFYQNEKKNDIGRFWNHKIKANF